IAIGFNDIAIWMSGDITRGVTKECPTFDSPALTDPYEFDISLCELWTIASVKDFNQQF
ncbi:MAG: hypothetical protein EZS28_027334, partial [Streblomastix strix]